MTKYEKLKALIFKASEDVEKDVMELKFGCEVLKEHIFKDGRFKAHGMIIRNMTYENETPIVDIFWDRGELDRQPITFLEIIGRPISLEDVLKALINLPGKDWDWRESSVNSTIKNWQLGLPLEQQSEETLDALIKLFE